MLQLVSRLTILQVFWTQSNLKLRTCNLETLEKASNKMLQKNAPNLRGSEETTLQSFQQVSQVRWNFDLLLADMCDQLV